MRAGTLCTAVSVPNPEGILVFLLIPIEAGARNSHTGRPPSPAAGTASLAAWLRPEDVQSD